MSLTCQDAIELLPWMINGSLEEREGRALLDHLTACESCRRELEETLRAWRLFAQHIPSLELARYAQGLPTSRLDRELIERHIERCSSCRQELSRASCDRVVDFQAARVTSAPAGRRDSAADRATSWRRFALAASITAVVTSGSLLWSHLGSSSSPKNEAAAALPVEEEGSRALLADRQSPSLQEETRMALFADGFELGTAANWSMTSQ